jgi:LacI family transcriptional regulator
MRSVDELKKRGAVSAAPRSGLTVIAPNRTIGLIIPGVAYSEFFSMVMDGVSQSCQKAGYTLLIGNVYSKSHTVRAQQAKDLAADFVRKGVAGVIFQPIELLSNATRINREIVSVLTASNIPVVLIDYDIVPSPERSEFDLVGINNFEAGRRLAEHLISKGAKSIHFLMRRHWGASVCSRLAGVNVAISKRGVHKCTSILLSEPDDVAKVRTYLKKCKPDAIICGNDTAAAYLKHTLESLGKRIPDDVMLAGFDDVQHVKIMSPRLTTIHQPCEDIADTAVRRLLERIKNPSLKAMEIFLSAPLVERESTNRILRKKRNVRC